MRITPFIAAVALFASNAHAAVAGLQGEFFDIDGPVTSLAQVEAHIGGNTADGTWTATRIDYAAGRGGSFLDFLGADEASYVGDRSRGGGAGERDTWAVRLTGFVRLDEPTLDFTIRSDDGFALSIGDALFSSFDGTRGAADTTLTASLGEGWFPIELIMWENGGRAALQFRLNDVIVGGDALASAIPLPGAALFLATGVMGLARGRRGLMPRVPAQG